MHHYLTDLCRRDVRMRIIFIEDNELFGDVIELYLCKEGYTVDWCREKNSANAILHTQEGNVIN